MTIERKIIVGLDDIRAICFECLKCGTRVALRPGSIKEIPLSCQHCSVEWIPRRTGIEARMSSAFEDFVISIERIMSLTKEGMTQTTFRILLEFDEPRQE
jgi:hypothetical protein